MDFYIPSSFDALDRYLKEGGLHQVEGWLAPNSASILASLGLFQIVEGVSGDLCEIGIHHGKLFIVLANLLAPGETAVAVDVFADQHKNIDQSGAGDRAKFEANLARHAPGARVRIIQGSSLDLGDLGFRDNRFRLFSIDGGHSALATRNDLELAEACAVPGGIVALDDLLSPQWLGVLTGLTGYFRGAGGLIPFALSTNKLYLTTDAAWAERYRTHLRSAFPFALDRRDGEFFDWVVDTYGENPRYFIEPPEAIQRRTELEQLRADLALSRQELDQTQAENTGLRDKLEQLHADLALNRQALDAVQAENTGLRADLDAFRASTSWRITGPLRATMTALRRLRAG